MATTTIADLKTTATPSSQGPSPQEDCPHWAGGQSCPNVSKCEKYHDPFKGPPIPKSFSQSTVNSKAVCKQYLKGHCRYGKGCRYRHDTPGQGMGRSTMPTLSGSATQGKPADQPSIPAGLRSARSAGEWIMAHNLEEQFALPHENEDKYEAQMEANRLREKMAAQQNSHEPAETHTDAAEPVDAPGVSASRWANVDDATDGMRRKVGRRTGEKQDQKKLPPQLRQAPASVRDAALASEQNASSHSVAPAAPQALDTASAPTSIDSARRQEVSEPLQTPPNLAFKSSLSGSIWANEPIDSTKFGRQKGGRHWPSPQPPSGAPRLASKTATGPSLMNSIWADRPSAHKAVERQTDARQRTCAQLPAASSLPRKESRAPLQSVKQDSSARESTAQRPKKYKHTKNMGLNSLRAQKKWVEAWKTEYFLGIEHEDEDKLSKEQIEALRANHTKEDATLANYGRRQAQKKNDDEQKADTTDSTSRPDSESSSAERQSETNKPGSKVEPADGAHRASVSQETQIQPQPRATAQNSETEVHRGPQLEQDAAPQAESPALPSSSVLNPLPQACSSAPSNHATTDGSRGPKPGSGSAKFLKRMGDAGKWDEVWKHEAEEDWDHGSEDKLKEGQLATLRAWWEGEMKRNSKVKSSAQAAAEEANAEIAA